MHKFTMAPVVAFLLMFAGFLLPVGAQAKSMKRMNERELVQLLSQSTDAAVREDAAELLGDLKSETAIPYLSKAAFEDPELDVRMEAISALERIRSVAALAEVQSIFEHDELPTDVRVKALKVLRKHAAELTDHGVPHFLSRYRTQEVPMVLELLEALVQRNRQDARDLPLLIAMDVGQKRKVRAEALKAAEALQHPRIYEAYLSLLDDPDKSMRIRCIDGLARSGLPGAKVGPALLHVVQTDADGAVRAAAFKAMKNYAHPNMLPVVHNAVLNETNPMAWGHAMDLLQALADASSVTTISILLGRDQYMTDESVMALVRVLVRIGDRSAVPHLESLKARTQSAAVATECDVAIAALGGGSARTSYLQSWSAPTDVHYWDTTAVEPEPPAMSMYLDQNGVVVHVDGLNLGMQVDDSSVSYQQEVYDNSGGYSQQQGTYQQPVYPAPMVPGPCADAILNITPIAGVWFDVFINGEKRAEARVGQGTLRIAGLKSGTYHVRIMDFMNNETWSEGRLQVECGDVFAGEVAEDQGLRILNNPQWYLPE